MLSYVDKDLFSSDSLFFFDMYDVSFMRCVIHGEIREYFMRNEIDDLNHNHYVPPYNIPYLLFEKMVHYLFGNNVSTSIVHSVYDLYKTLDSRKYIEYFKLHFKDIGVYDLFNGDPIEDGSLLPNKDDSSIESRGQDNPVLNV